MIKFNLIIIVFAIFSSMLVSANECAEVTLEKSFFESQHVVLVEYISTKLTKSEFVNDYLKKREGLKGYDKKKYLRLANLEWDAYNERPNVSSFFVKAAFKGQLKAGEIINVLNMVELKFSFGNSYVLFLTRPDKTSNNYLFDSCVYFNFTKNVYFQDTVISNAGTYSAAVENLVFLSKAQ